jgi:hypothetical protein
MADIITFDPAYFQELSGGLKDVSGYLDEAKASLQKASVGLDSGLVAFALCAKLNEDIKQIKKTADARISETNGYSKALVNGVTRVSGWEDTTKNRESGLATQLGKTWEFENGNFSGDAASAGKETTNAAATNSPNLADFDLNSKYYPEAQSLNSFDNKIHIDCFAFANARAKEANQVDSLTSQRTDNTVQANSIARYDYDDGTNHYVFIERVEEVNGNTIVHFREGNWGGSPDGELKSKPLSEFEHRGKGGGVGGYVAEYTHY